MKTVITDIAGIGPSTAKILGKHGFRTVEGVAGATAVKLAQVPGFGKVRAARVIAAAKRLVSGSRTGSTSSARTSVNRGLQIHRQAAGKKSKNKSKKIVYANKPLAAWSQSKLAKNHLSQKAQTG